jgi:hypothetical protein
LSDVIFHEAVIRSGEINLPADNVGDAGDGRDEQAQPERRQEFDDPAERLVPVLADGEEDHRQRDDHHQIAQPLRRERVPVALAGGERNAQDNDCDNDRAGGQSVAQGKGQHE